MGNDPAASKFKVHEPLPGGDGVRRSELPPHGCLSAQTSKVFARPASNRHRVHDPALRVDCDTDRKQHPAMDGCERLLGDVGNLFMHC